jgi:putative acetyltransferase
MNNMVIRSARPGDANAIAAVTRDAFRAHPHSSQTEPFIVSALRQAGALSISLVAECADSIVGHIAFSPVAISDGSPAWYGLGPVSVTPQCQRQGIGQALVRQGLSRLRERDAQGCVLLGEPVFYGHFGFVNRPDLVLQGVPPAYFLALAFGDGHPRGTVAYHAAFDAQG